MTGIETKGCPFFFWPSPNLNMFVHTHFNRTLATNHNSVPVLINSFLSVQFTPFKSLFHVLCTNLDFFSTTYGNILHIYHVGDAVCLLLRQIQVSEHPFLITNTASHFEFSFPHFLSFKSLRTRYKVGGECLVWLAICDTLTFAVCNSTIAFYFLTTTALVFLSPLLNGLYID